MYPMDPNWREYNITANNLPAVNRNTYFTIYDTTTAPPDSVNVDITAYVRGRLSNNNDTNNLQFSFYMSTTTSCALPQKESGLNSIFAMVRYETDTRVTCGGMNTFCPPGDRCCQDSVLGPVCYNTTTHNCLPSAPGPRLCGINDAVCGTVCYDPSTDSCLGGTKLCPYGWSTCNGNCYNTSQYDCVSTTPSITTPTPTPTPTSFFTTTTTTTTTTTGNSAENSQETPTPTTITRGVLCPKGHLFCSTSCYDPSVNDCVAVSESEGGVGGVAVEVMLCPKGWSVCGGKCFDPYYYTCFTDLLCEKNFHRCGSMCYNPSAYACDVQQESSSNSFVNLVSTSTYIM